MLDAERPPCNYSSPSQVHSGPDGGLDNVKYGVFRGKLRDACKLSETEFEERLAEAAQIVDERFENDRWDEVFKGAWYGALIREDVKKWLGHSLDVKAFFKSLQLTLHPQAG